MKNNVINKSLENTKDWVSKEKITNGLGKYQKKNKKLVTAGSYTSCFEIIKIVNNYF